MKNPMILGLNEAVNAIKNPYGWVYFSIFDATKKYRRTLLGPIWITISFALFIVIMGVLWKTLFKMDISEYLPFFCVGILIWQFVFISLNESSSAFLHFSSLIRSTAFNPYNLVMRIIGKNIINFCHNIVVVFAVIIIYGGHISLDAGLRFMVGFIMLWFVLVNVCLILALIGARYRDVGPIIENLTTIIYYVTPIIWMPKQIPHEYEFIYELNPVYNLIELLRAPLMGWEVSNGAYLYAMWILILTTILASYLSGKYKNRIAYWI